MSDLICRKTMMHCQTPGMCSPHGGCQPFVAPRVQVTSIEAPGMIVEKDLFGTVHLKLKYEGGEPFDFVQIQYDHRFTSNSHQHHLAQRIASAIAGVDPEKDQLKAENEALRSARVPAGLYRELVALRELRDQTKKYVDSYLLDEVEDADNCVSEDQHLCAAELSERLMDAFEAHWDSAMSGVAPNKSEVQ